MQPRHFCSVVHPFSSHDLGSIFINLHNTHTSAIFTFRFMCRDAMHPYFNTIRFPLCTFPVNSWNTLQNTFCPCLILVYKLNTQHKGSQYCVPTFPMFSNVQHDTRVSTKYFTLFCAFWYAFHLYVSHTKVVNSVPVSLYYVLFFHNKVLTCRPSLVVTFVFQNVKYRFSLAFLLSPKYMPRTFAFFGMSALLRFCSQF